MRRRSDPAELPYRAPGGPVGLWLGGAASLAVALVNAVSVPAAGVAVLAWLLLGALVFIAALKTQARALDLRGHADPHPHVRRSVAPGRRRATAPPAPATGPSTPSPGRGREPRQA